MINKKIILLITLITLFSFINAETSNINICCFSLNSNQECAKLKKLSESMNQTLSSNISVTEFMPNGFNPEKAFKAMIENTMGQSDPEKQNCDGLIISGHHAGFWDGDKSSEKLLLKFLEDLSCDPKYSDWFDNVKALWLQGCRTYRVGQEENDDYISSNTHRLTPERLIDHIEASIPEIEQGFSFILDRENPLSLRYLRLFDSATIWGWEASAPTDKNGSWRSILYHIANMINIRYDNEKVTKNIKPNIENNKLSKDQLEAGLNILDAIVTGKHDIICPKEANEAWKSHWPGAYGIPPIIGDQKDSHPDSKRLLKAKKDNCTLFQSIDPDQIIKTIDSIIKDQKSIGYSFNSIIETLSRLENSSIPNSKTTYSKVINNLQKNENVQHYLWKKLSSKKGFLSKIEYYGVAKKYNLLNFNENEIKKVNAIENSFRKEVIKELNWKASEKKVPLRDMIDYKATLLESLSQHGFADDTTFIDEVLEIRNLEKFSVLNKISKYMHTFNSEGFSREKKIETIKKIIEHPQKDFHTDKFLIMSIFNSYKKNSENSQKNLTKKDLEDLLEEIIDGQKLSPTTAYYCSLVLNTIKNKSARALQIHNKIISYDFNIENLKKELKETYENPEEYKNAYLEEKEAIEKARKLSSRWIEIIQ